MNSLLNGFASNINFSIRSKLNFLFFLFLIVLVSTSSYVLMNMNAVVVAFKKEVHTQEQVMGNSHRLAKLIIDMETGQRGFVITGKDEFLQPYKEARVQFDRVLSALKENLKDQQQYQDDLIVIGRLRDTWIRVAGIPEIEARRMVTRASISLKTIDQMINAGEGKRILDQIRADLTKMSNNFRAVDKIEELLLTTLVAKSIVDAETGQRGYLLAGKKTFLEPYDRGQIELAQHSRKLEQILQNDPANLRLLFDVKALFEQWLVRAARPEINAREQYERNPQSIDDVAQILAKGTGKGLMDEMRIAIHGLITNLERDIHQALTQTEQNVTFANRLSLVVSVIGIILAFVCVFMISQSLVTSIGTLIKGTEIIGAGQFDYRIDVSSNDEMRDLASSFNKMAGDLRSVSSAVIEAKAFTDNIIRSLVDTLIVVETNGSIRMVNSAAIKLLGYDEEELLGKLISDILKQPEGEGEGEGEEVEHKFFFETLVNRLSLSNTVSGIEQRYVTKGGRAIPMLFSAVLMRSLDGEIESIVCVAQDLSEIRIAEAEKARLQDQITQNSHLVFIGGLAAKVAHEINNPNNSIGFNASLLADAWPDLRTVVEAYCKENGDFYVAGRDYSEMREEIPEMLSQIGASSERIKNIVRELRELSKNDIMYQMETVNIVEVIKSSISMLQDRIQQYTDYFSLETCSAEQLFVKGHTQKLEQALMNVILNALQALPDREGKVSVSATLEQNREKIVVVIKDEGIGIASSDLDKITDTFYSTKSDEGGTGLGLAITSNIVVQHEGELTFESSLGVGTTVNIRLPAVKHLEEVC